MQAAEVRNPLRDQTDTRNGITLMRSDRQIVCHGSENYERL